MSSESDDWESDDDYVPSLGDTSPLYSFDSDDEVNVERLKAKGKKKADGAVEENGTKDREKTEDELWNEFLGGSGETKNTTEKDKIRKSKDSKIASAEVSSSKPDSVSSGPIVIKSIFEEADSTNGIKCVDDPITQENEGSESNSVDDYAVGQSTKPKGSVGAFSQKAVVSSFLERFAKDKKVTTLEKSRQDWEGYKVREGITEELSTHNKGKGGFLDKKEFLERADYRQFEKERDLRLSRKRKSPLD